MIRAQLLLARTSLSIKEVMAQVGCNDPSHFGRDFRTFHGLSPYEWRLAAAHRSLRGRNGDALDSTSMARVVFLANQRAKRSRKPMPRARAPAPAPAVQHLF